MEDEADRLNNLCADLVSLRRLEPGLVHLFRDRPAGGWVPVAELYRRAGEPVEGIKPELVVTWLPSPSAQAGYAVVLFCDDDLQWSLTAYHNVGRALGEENARLTATK